jgi:hypothetical protein
VKVRTPAEETVEHRALLITESDGILYKLRTPAEETVEHRA